MDDDFAAYAAASWPRLMRSARLLGLTSEKAQDLVQETLLRCFVKWRRVLVAGVGALDVSRGGPRGGSDAESRASGRTRLRRAS